MLIKINDNGVIKQIELKNAIKNNYFKDIYLQVLLEENNKDKLNIYYKIKANEFKLDSNLTLDLVSGSVYTKLKKIKQKLLTEKEVKELIEPILILWEYRLNTRQFNIWYNSLKLFNKKDLELKVQIICQRCVFKPKLGDFYK